MGAADEAARLRAEADALDEIAGLEKAARAAKEAYQEDPSEGNREAHRAASQALSDARESARADRDDLDGAVRPGTVRAAGSAGEVN